MAKIKEMTNELENLVNLTNSSPVNTSIDEGLPEELEVEPAFEIDYSKEKRNCRKKARKDIVFLVSSIVPIDVINSDIIQNKINQDADQLGKLYWQQNMIEIIQQTNMDSLAKGNISPRMFEAFTQLSKNHSDIAKQIADFQVTMRRNYNEMKYDVRSKAEDDKMLTIGPTNGNTINMIESTHKADEPMFLGTKDIVNEIIEKKKRKILNKQ